MTATEALALPIGIGILVYGVARLRRYRNRPCHARFEANPTTTFTCARVNRHRGAHSDPSTMPYSFEWYDERRGKDPAPPA